MGEKMRNAPVYFAIVQVRHNPVLQLGTYVAEIQEKMRRAGYPDFMRGATMVFNMTVPAQQEAEKSVAPQVSQNERYLFSNLEKDSGFILEPTAVTFQTTSYDTFEPFLAEFLKGLGIVHDCVALGYSERLGLRYLDAVVPEGGERELDKYLVNEVLGLARRLPDDTNVVMSFSETHIRRPAGNLLCRTIIRNGPLGFPIDMQPGPLVLKARFASIEGVHAILDTDASREGREPFDIAKAKAMLSELHGEVRMVFDVTATKHAFKAWE